MEKEQRNKMLANQVVLAYRWFDDLDCDDEWHVKVFFDKGLAIEFGMEVILEGGDGELHDSSGVLLELKSWRGVIDTYRMLEAEGHEDIVPF